MSHRRTERNRDRPTSLGRLPNFVMSIQVTTRVPPGGEMLSAEEGGGRRQTAMVKKMLFKFLDAVPRHEVEGDDDVEVAGKEGVVG